MGDKKEIDWEAKYKKLLAKNKNTKPKEDKFVSENLEAFAEILDPNKPFLKKFGKRYCFARKDRTSSKMENVIKINKLVSDLIDAKILLNDGVENVANRRSMDVGSLIKSLGGQRINEDDYFAFKSWQRDLKLKMKGKFKDQVREELTAAQAKIEDLTKQLLEKSAPTQEKLPGAQTPVIDKLIAGNTTSEKCPYADGTPKANAWYMARE